MGRSKRSKNKTKIKKASKKELQIQYKLALDLKKKVNRKMEQRYLIGFYDSFRNGGKYNLTYAYTNSSLTYKLNDDIVHTVVLQKLAMSVAGGVPCVGSTFFMP